MLLTSPVFAAKPSGLSKPQAQPELYRLKNPVQQVQELLKSQGFYQGKTDGLMGADLKQAIRLYQKKHGLKQTGKISDDLIKHMANIGRVQALIKKLDPIRTNRQQQARQALLSDPRTRQLLDQKEKETADPTRDASTCFQAPTARCLIHEAVESSRAVFEDDMRDWALGEILAAQVRVGLENDAMKTAARIKDSRLVIAALTTIAKTHVREGQLEEARSALSLIPVMERRLSVLLDIASYYQSRNQTKLLRHTVTKILAGAQSLDHIENSLTIQIQAIELLALIDKKRALEMLDKMTLQAEASAKNGSKFTLIRQIANAMAHIGYPEWALKTIGKMPDDETRIPILMAAARAFLKAKRFKAAHNTIERISSKRYRSVILSDMAQALWQHQQNGKAFDILDEALIIAKATPLPFARNFALSHVAQSYMIIAKETQKQAHGDLAYHTLSLISDERIKARGLWNLAYAASHQQLKLSTQNLDKNAHQTLNNIKSKFSRAWLIGDLVALHQNSGDHKQARKAFEIGMATIKTLTNPWARSRVLAKFGALAHRLD